MIELDAYIGLQIIAGFINLIEKISLACETKKRKTCFLSNNESQAICEYMRFYFLERLKIYVHRLEIQ